MNAHGYGAYTQGCRCDICREAKREYMRRRRAEGPRPTLACGTSAQYDQGCRCKWCRIAKSNEHRREFARNVETYRKARQRRLRMPTPPHVHGTRTGYTAYGCRCLPCTDAERIYDAARRKARAS